MRQRGPKRIERAGTGEHVDVDVAVGALRDGRRGGGVHQSGEDFGLAVQPPRRETSVALEPRRTAAVLPWRRQGHAHRDRRPIGHDERFEQRDRSERAVRPRQLRRREVELEMTGAWEHGDTVGCAVLVDQPVMGSRQPADHVDVAGAVGGTF